ncbi:MAG: peptide chain release factor H [Chromatiales bacterium]|nr:peptide chain release factor H [Chromatiales bacterium]
MSEPTLWLQMSAGRCPSECEWVVGRLVPVLTQELAARGLAVEEIDRTPGTNAGDARSVLLRVSGPEVTAKVADWLGTVQWIGTSPYRPHHKRKNWFVSVAAFVEPNTPTWNERELNIETLRASGPGGQHVNRTESAVRVTHRPTGLSVLAQEERSQHLNRRLALARLAALLAERAERQSQAAEDQRWRQHTQLERGNAVRVYRGLDWKRERSTWNV